MRNGWKTCLRADKKGGVGWTGGRKNLVLSAKKKTLKLPSKAVSNISFFLLSASLGGKETWTF